MRIYGRGVADYTFERDTVPLPLTVEIDRVENNVEQAAELALYACRLRSWLERY